MDKYINTNDTVVGVRCEDGNVYYLHRYGTEELPSQPVLPLPEGVLKVDKEQYVD